MRDKKLYSLHNGGQVKVVRVVASVLVEVTVVPVTDVLVDVTVIRVLVSRNSVNVVTVVSVIVFVPVRTVVLTRRLLKMVVVVSVSVDVWVCVLCRLVVKESTL